MSRVGTLDLYILEYSTATVHRYTIAESVEVNDSLIADLGFDVDSCYWMAGNCEFIKHKGTIMEINASDE